MGEAQRPVCTGPAKLAKFRVAYIARYLVPFTLSSVLEKRKRGIIGCPTIPLAKVEDYFGFFSVISPFFSVALSGFAALTELTIIFPSFSV